MATHLNTGRDRRGGTAGFGCLLFCIPFLIALWPLILIFTWWEDYRAGALRREFIRHWGSIDKRGLLVYSNSPHWQRYVEEQWLPRIGQRLVILNWSERARWNREHPFEARIFRRFAGDREFNPLAVIFLAREPHATFRAWLRAIKARDPLGMLAPSVRDVQVIRFWKAFRDFKHGKETALRAAEADLFAAIVGETPSVGI